MHEIISGIVFVKAEKKKNEKNMNAFLVHLRIIYLSPTVI